MLFFHPSTNTFFSLQVRTFKLQSWLFASQNYCYERKRAESTMKQKKLRSIDRCECIPGTFVSILHFPSTGRKQWEERRKKESEVIPFEFNTAGRLIDHALWLRCPGKSTLNQSVDEWANTWNTGLIVVKMTVIRMNGFKCANGCFFYFFSFREIQNGCMPEWAMLSSERQKNRNTF